MIPLNVTPFLELARALKTDLLYPREITSPPLSTQSPSSISMSRPSTNKALRPTTILQPQIRRATQGHRYTQPPGPPMGSTKKVSRVTIPCLMPGFRISSDNKELAAFGLNHWENHVIIHNQRVGRLASFNHIVTPGPVGPSEETKHGVGIETGDKTGQGRDKRMTTMVYWARHQKVILWWNSFRSFLLLIFRNLPF